MNQIHGDHPSLKNVDQYLRAFFQKEMPDPWPPANVPSPQKRQGVNFGWYVRLVIAASLALVLVGYLTLASMFPPTPEPGLSIDRSQTIGMKPHVHAPRNTDATPKPTEPLQKDAINR
jgi:hypothetical protein